MQEDDFLAKLDEHGLRFSWRDHPQEHADGWMLSLEPCDVIIVERVLDSGRLKFVPKTTSKAKKPGRVLPTGWKDGKLGLIDPKFFCILFGMEHSLIPRFNPLL